MTSNFINVLYQDHEGFLWMGSKSGVDRWDGSNITSFTHKMGYPNSLLYNEVQTFFEDQHNQMWIGTLKGLSIYSLRTANFKNLTELVTADSVISIGEGIRNIVEYNGRIWISSNKSLLTTQSDTSVFIRMRPDLVSSKFKPLYYIPNTITPTPKGLWVSTSRGLIYTADGNHFYSAENNPEHWKILDIGWVSSVANDGDSLLYCSKFMVPLVYVWNMKNFHLDSITIQTGDGDPYIMVMSIAGPMSGEIWGATLNKGVFRLNMQTGVATFYKKNGNDINGLSSNQIFCVLSDNKGSTFFGTDHGLNYINNIQPPFHFINIQNTALADENLAITEDDHDLLWLATLGKGLFTFNIKNEEIHQYPLPDDYNTIWDMDLAGNQLTLSTPAGLATFNTDTKIFKRMLFNLPIEINNLLKTESTFIMKDEKGFIWLGTKFRGIIKYNPGSGEFIHFNAFDPVYHLPVTQITTACKGDAKKLWIGFMDNQIAEIDMESDSVDIIKLTLPDSTENTGIVTCMKMDVKGNLWIGMSQGGLFRYHIQSKILSHFDTENGLAHNRIGSLVIDQNDLVWAGTPKGLNKFDPVSEKFVFYNRSDGLLFNQYDASPNFVTHSGKLIVFSENTITWFNTNNFPSNPYFPVLVFQSYRKSGQEFSISPEVKQINFTHKDKIISFDFTGINFIDPNKTEYAYFLDHYDDTWNYTRNVSHATYTSLPRGDYTLRVKATNKAGMWDVPESTLKIHVAGPFWITWWFISSCLAFSFIIIYSIYRYRLAQFKKILDIRNKISQDLHDDIGSTLGSISIQSASVQHMKREDYTEILSTVKHMGESTRSAMENMSDIVWAINPKNDSFKSMIDRFKIASYKLLDARNIKLDVSIPEGVEKIKLDIEQRKNLYLILREAIYNVAKYSEASHCQVTATALHKTLQMLITDDGKGFDHIASSLGGNGLINMKQRAAELKGMLNIQSGAQKGTSIALQFPLN